MTEPGQSQRKAQVVGFVSLIVIAVAFAFVFDRWIMPPSRPTFAHPSAVDVLIDSRLTVGLIRLVAILFAIYVVVSLVAHMKAGRYLTVFGMLTTDWTDERNQLKAQIAETEEKYTELAGEYQEAMDLLVQVAERMSDSAGTDEQEGADDEQPTSP